MSNTSKNEIMINGKKVASVINLQKIAKGVQTESGEVQGEIIWDVSQMNHSAWFVLDLETGSRGWYPGKKNDL